MKPNGSPARFPWIRAKPRRKRLRFRAAIHGPEKDESSRPCLAPSGSASHPSFYLKRFTGSSGRFGKAANQAKTLRCGLH